MANNTLTIEEQMAAKKAQMIEAARARTMAKKLERMDTPSGEARMLNEENLKTLDEILADIESSIKGKIRPAYSYGPLTNKIISVCLTLQFATKDDRAAIDPEYYEMISETDRDIIINAAGSTPFFADAVYVANSNDEMELLEVAKIVNAEKNAQGQWEYTAFPDIDELMDITETIALELGLLDPQLNGLTTRELNKSWKRALDKATTDMRLAEALETNGDEVSYEE